MNLEVRELKHVSVVTITGRVDSATAPDLQKAIQDLLDSDHKQLVLDLKDVDYMSSAGLRVLVALQKAAKKIGGALRLAQLSVRVSEVLELSGLTPVFEIYPDVVEAVGAV